MLLLGNAGHSTTATERPARLQLTNAASADAPAPAYIARPMSKFPLNPTIIPSRAARTVPTMDATTFTPHKSVVLLPPEERDAMPMSEGNWNPIKRPAGDRRANVRAALAGRLAVMLESIIPCRKKR